MSKIIVPICGMHCKSCEMLVEEKLSQIPEITKANVSCKRGEAEIHFGSQKPNQKEIEEAIREAGYSVGAKEKIWLSKNPSDYKDLGIAFLFLLGIYLVLKNFGLTNINLSPSVSNPESFSVVFLIGITAGFSSCMALVGGLILGISSRHAEKHPEATAWQKFRPHIFFNVGRILSYAFLGGMLGILGSFFQISSLFLGTLTIIVGVVMLLMGLQLIEIFPALSDFKITLPKSLSRMIGIKNDTKEYSHRGSFILGALTFFLPCGFTQAMQLLAVSTGSFALGALVMGIFALGTAPGLLGVGGITSLVKGIFAKRFFKFAGILVILFSLINIANGYNLTGWQVNSSSGKRAVSSKKPKDDLNNEVQTIRMTETSRGYSPNSFTIKKGIPVRWIIDVQDPLSCASSIVMNKFNISKRLSKGENIIEFTPTEAGTIRFSCSMGMYTGSFNVTN